MAKPKKSPKKKARKRTVHPITRGAESRKRPSDKPAGLGGTGRECCTDAMVALAALLATAPSGSLLTIEDGFPVLVEPPTVPSYLAIDPGGSGLPYWEPS